MCAVARLGRQRASAFPAPRPLFEVAHDNGASPDTQQDRPLDQTGGTDRGDRQRGSGGGVAAAADAVLDAGDGALDPADHTVDRGSTDRPRRGDGRLC